MQRTFGREMSRISALTAVGLTLALAAPTPLMAQSNAPSGLRTLSVSGHGEVEVVPDEARLSTGVVSEAPTAADALAANRRAMNAVFAALKQQGIPDKSIQTSGINVSPQYDLGKTGNEAQRIVSYRVSNDISVIVDDLSRLGATIDALVASGANSLGGIGFTIRDPKPLFRQARAEAVKDAMDRAETYAKAAGVTLGRIAAISENEAAPPRPLYFAIARVESGAVTPTAAGEEAVSAGVSMTFEIK